MQRGSTLIHNRLNKEVKLKAIMVNENLFCYFNVKDKDPLLETSFKFSLSLDEVDFQQNRPVRTSPIKALLSILKSLKIECK